MKIFRTFAVLATGLVLLLGADAKALSITRVLDVHFGSDPAAGSVSITFDDSAGVDQVKITLDASGLASDENVTEWYFNYSGDGGTTFDATGLTASALSGSGSDAITEADLNANSFFSSQSEQADGDGNYNIMVDFNTSPPTFDGGEVVMFTLSGVVGLTADDFDFFSDEGGGQGAYISAAKIQMTNCIDPADPKCDGDDNEGSDWLGAVPEPGPLALFSTSLIVAGALMRRPRAR
jgi:hypothetical protein